MFYAHFLRKIFFMVEGVVLAKSVGEPTASFEWEPLLCGATCLWGHVLCVGLSVRGVYLREAGT